MFMYHEGQLMYHEGHVERNSNLTCQIYVMKCLSDRDAKMQE